jgi:Tfp pilus assembly protein PilW
MTTCGKKTGFTLVELMITMFSAAILVLIVTLILFMGYSEWRVDNEYAKLRRDAAFAIQLMSKEIRQSSITNVITAPENLTLTATANRPHTVSFRRGAGSAYARSLTCYSDDILRATLVSKGCRDFSQSTNDHGVLLTLVMVNADESISMTNQTFIYTRN